MIDDTNLLTFDGTTAVGVVVAGPIYNSSGAVAKTSPGLLTLSGSNTYGGPTTVSAGTLRLAAPTQLSGGNIFSSPIGTGTLTLAAGTTLQDDGVPRTLANNLVINGNVTFSSAGAGSVTFDSSGLTTPTTVTLNNNSTLNVTNTTTIKSGMVVNAGTLAKSGSGTLEIDAAPVLAANSAIQAGGGVLRFKVASGSAAVGTGVTATVSPGATLELAGSVSALSAGANRANVSNNSLAAAGGLLVSGGNQQVGAIDGSGNIVVGSDASLTANHIIQNALIIGGTTGHPATVTIAASDSAGNSMAAESSDFAPSIAASSSARIGQFNTEMLSSASPLAAPVFPRSPVAATDLVTVPEPSAVVLFAFGVVALALFWPCALRKEALAFLGE
jgi:fibronectin-binding autotransporter adhesin